MGVAKNIERRLEGLMEGFFARVFRSGVQPVEIGRRILREMDEGRTVSVNRTYAPNDFHISLGPDDHARFVQMEAGLQREFSDLVIDHAKNNRWNLMGLPRISFAEEEGMGKGQYRVEASLAADPDAPAPRFSTRERAEGGLDATNALSSGAAARLGASPAAQLVVLDDDGTPRDRIAITRAPVTIGRLSSCDVVLSDPNISRRHAELRRNGSRWTIVDLGSTNGTLVNGKLTKEHDLSDGDKVSFGTSEIVFKTDSGS